MKSKGGIEPVFCIFYMFKDRGMSMGTGIGLTDAVANKDLFDIGSYVRGLSNFIKECNTPMTIAIQGNQGAGKTSIMRMVEEELSKDPSQFFYVEFNTWESSQFDMDKKLPIVMIQSLMDSLSDDKEKNLESVKAILKMAVSINADYMSHGTTGDLDKEFKKSYSAQLTDLKQEFQLLVNKRAGIIPAGSKLNKMKPQENAELLQKTDGNKRVVFFIDDLDRLNPGNALQILEVLKIILDCRNCVFVLAIDYDVVRQGLAERYGRYSRISNEEISKRGKDFFDKVIQVSFRVPVSSYKANEYIKACLEAINVPVYSDSDIDTYALLIRKSIGANPRILKRMMNSMALIISVIGREKFDEEKSYKLLFAVLCIQYGYVNLYNYLVSILDDLEFAFLHNIAHKSAEELKKQLADVDLSKTDTDKLHAFLEVFVDKAMDLDDSGKVELSGDHDEMEMLREILYVSIITSVKF